MTRDYWGWGSNFLFFYDFVKKDPFKSVVSGFDNVGIFSIEGCSDSVYWFCGTFWKKQYFSTIKYLFVSYN